MTFQRSLSRLPSGPLDSSDRFALLLSSVTNGNVAEAGSWIGDRLKAVGSVGNGVYFSRNRRLLRVHLPDPSIRTRYLLVFPRLNCSTNFVPSQWVIASLILHQNPITYVEWTQAASMFIAILNSLHMSVSEGTLPIFRKSDPFFANL